MSNRVILLYGIETIPGGSEARNWPTRLEAVWDQQDQPLRAYSWQWSGLYWKYAIGFFTILPIIGAWYRRAINQVVIDNLRGFEEFLENYTGKDETFSIVVHSYAGSILQQALEEGRVFNNIIMIQTTMDENFDWFKYDSQFNNVRIYYSPNDSYVGRVIGHYGIQGRTGALVDHPRVENVLSSADSKDHFRLVTPQAIKDNAQDWAEFLKK